MSGNKGLKSIHVPKGYKGLHIELPGCIVNIQVGLHDRDWQEVVRIDVLAIGERFAGEQPWFAEGSVDWNGAGIRVVKEMPGSEFSRRRKQGEIKQAMGNLACAVS
jgi:hypothetical protein